MIKERTKICPNCHSKIWFPYAHFSNFSILKSSECQLLRTKISKNFSGIGEEMYENRLEVKKHYYKQGKFFKIYAQKLLDLLPIQRGKLLDVGCGFGWIVAEAKSRGFEAKGIDKSKVYPQMGRTTLKINLETVPLEKFRTLEKFNVITVNHVLEHISDPNLFLIKIKSLLTPGGYLLAACPNIQSIMFNLFHERWYGLQPAQHIWQFTPQSLTMLLINNHFSITKVNVNNLGYQVPGWKGDVFKLILKVADLTRLGDQVIVIATNSH